MTDPIGQNSYSGLAVPLYGESVIRQRNSSCAALSLMHCTTNEGRFLMGIDYKIEGDIGTTGIGDLAVCDIDAEGGFRCVSGTTVKMELNSSGLFVGSTNLVNTSGEIIPRQPITAITTGAAYSVTTAMSGTLFTVGVNDTSSQSIALPINPEPGMWFDFFVSSQDATADVIINTTGDSSAKIQLPGFTSAVSTGDNIQPLTTDGYHFVRMTAVSSVLWVARTAAGYAEAATSDFQITELNAGHWGAASTVA